MNNQTDPEKEELKKRIAELEKLVLSLPYIETAKDEEDDIKSDKLIRVMSLCNHQLNLSVSLAKDARHWTFDKFGQIRQIPFSLLLQVVENHPTFAEQGLFYILDRKVVRKLGLTEYYDALLTKDKIEKILTTNSAEALSLYKSANQRQREIINVMLIERVRDGADIDLNIIYGISKEGKVDIIAKADEARAYSVPST